jgi:hypothetical protein
MGVDGEHAGCLKIYKPVSGDNIPVAGHTATFYRIGFFIQRYRGADMRGHAIPRIANGYTGRVGKLYHQVLFALANGLGGGHI